MLLKEQMALIRKHQTDAPVRVTPIANELGLKVFKVSDWADNISGMLRKMGDGGRFAIFVNGSHAETRRRFTIAHEIAHFVLHAHLIRDGIVEDALLRAAGFSSALESQANAFAADILMPWHLLNQYQARGTNTIEELSATFNVSRDAMSVRLLGLPYSKARDVGMAEQSASQSIQR